MHVYEALYCEVRPVRSHPKNSTKQFISLIIDVVDPPKLKGQHPVISPDLERVLSDIQKGTEQRLEVLKSKKKQAEQGESSVKTLPKSIGRIEKMEQRKKLRASRKVMVVQRLQKKMSVVDRWLTKVQLLQQKTSVADRWPTEVKQQMKK